MFREMRRKKQQIPDNEAIAILENSKVGILAVNGDSGYPYTVPLNYMFYNGKIYFHGAKSGHKIDAIKNCDKVSFCVYDKGYRKENDWALNIKSVIVFGRVRFVEDQDTINQICTNMCDKFTDDKEYAKVELSKCGSSVLCLEVNPEHITGKLVNES